VIEQGVFVKHQKVEVYFLQLKLSLFADVTTVIARQFSHATTIGTKSISINICIVVNFK